MVRLLGSHALDRRENARHKRRSCAFLSGVKNPIGVKIGPSAKAEDVVALANKLNPENEAGRLNVIIRMGATRSAKIYQKF